MNSFGCTSCICAFRVANVANVTRIWILVHQLRLDREVEVLSLLLIVPRNDQVATACQWRLDVHLPAKKQRQVKYRHFQSKSCNLKSKLCNYVALISNILKQDQDQTLSH